MRDEHVTLETTAGPTAAFLATPDAWPTGAAVVVIQEWWGLNDNIRGAARRLADEGFAALAPDLYYGTQATEPDDAEKLMMSLDEAQALANLRTAVGWLLDAGATSVGAMGFCMGGGLTWQLALTDERCRAAVPFYGWVGFEGRRALAPVQSHYGTEDDFEPAMLDEIRAHLGDVPGSEFHLYEGAPHAFMNETRPQAYRPHDAEVAWDRLLGFFRQHLS